MPKRLRAVLVLVVLSLSTAGRAQDSLNVTARGRLDAYSSYSDIWGYTTQSGRDYALIGTATGTSIVDVTEPTTPSESAFISGPTSVWRDIKTHAGYAYIVTEDGSAGIQIVDLEAKPFPMLVASFDSTLDQAHNIGIFDGRAYVFGASLSGAGVGTRILSLEDPTHPEDLGAFTTYYVHDGVVRNDTLWGAAITTKQIAVVDVSDPTLPSVLTTFTWQGSNAHDCDLSPDGRTLFTTDEMTGGDLHVFDVSNLGNVQELTSWGANPQAIIHNVHVNGNLAYISYYTEGVRIVDVANPEFPVEVGYYDTWPGASGGFNGAWGVYPFATSGLIYASDISGGLYVLEYEQTLGALQGTVSAAGEGTPLPGADVELLGAAQAPTSSTGFYKMYEQPGSYTVVTSRFGFEAESTLVELTAGATTVHDVALVRVPSSPLAGTIVDASDQSALGSVSVVVQGTPLVTTTDALGAYAFDDVPYGVYMLGLSRFGYAPEQHSVTVSVVSPGYGVGYDFALDPAPLTEDFESGPGGWLAGDVDDTASAGIWVWADPVGSGGGAIQPEDDHSDPGALCWVTGNAASPTASINAADVDGGKTTLTTPLFDLSAMSDPHIRYWRWFSNDGGFTPTTADTLRVDLSNNAGVDWVNVERVTQSAPWTQVTVRVLDVMTPTNWMRLRFVAEDAGSASTVEAAIDDLSAFDLITTDASTPPAGRVRLHVAPNPFNPRTSIRYDVAASGPALLRIVDVRGRLIRQLRAGVLEVGRYEHTWDGLDAHGQRVASGSYWVQLHAAGQQRTLRVVLLQ